MNFENIIKDKNIVAYTIMKNAMDRNKIPHAYLFSAPIETEIEVSPLFFIQKMISKDTLRDPMKYSDLRILDGSKSLIKKEDVLKAISFLQETPLDSIGKKFLWIKNIENSNKQSLNSLLKFIEEPTKDTYILITTNNLSTVLPTIKSRSQIINIRRDDIDTLSKNIVSRGIDSNISRLLASIYGSEEKIMNLNINDFNKIKEKVVDVMSDALNNPDVIVIEFSKLITKANHQIFLAVLREFINDVWRHTQMLKTSFKNIDGILDKYSMSKFKFEKALSSINNFIVSQTHNVNFDLYKNKTLIEIKECYG